MKRIIKILLICLLAGVLAPVWGAQIEQPSPWAKDAVTKLKAWGRIDSSYYTKYQILLTRKEFAGLSVTVYEALSGKPTEGISDELKQTFKDTEDPDILLAWQLGIVSGDGSGNFKPNAPITREQLAKMMVLLAEKSGKPLQQGNKKLPAFRDNSAISPWAENAINICMSQGVMNGVGNNLIDPQGNVTREQALVMIASLMELKGTLST